MKLELTKTDVWVASLKDKPGALAQALKTLHEAGVNLDFVIGRKAPEKKGTGVVFVTPIKGARQVKAAKAAGFAKSKSLHSIRVVCNDVPGLGAMLAEALAAAKINLRGISAASIGKKAVTNIAFRTAADAATGMRCLKKLSK